MTSGLWHFIAFQKGTPKKKKKILAFLIYGSANSSKLYTVTANNP